MLGCSFVSPCVQVQLLNKKERRHLKRKAEAEAREREEKDGGAREKKN